MRLSEFMKIFGLRFDVDYTPDNEDRPYAVAIPNTYFKGTEGGQIFLIGMGITFDTAVSELIRLMNENRRIFLSTLGSERSFPLPLIESL